MTEAEARDVERDLIAWMAEDAFWQETDYLSPHAYILRRVHPELVDKMRALIASEGYAARFQGQTWKYVDLGAYRYWLAGGHALNRARLDAGGRGAGVGLRGVKLPGRKTFEPGGIYGVSELYVCRQRQRNNGRGARPWWPTSTP